MMQLMVKDEPEVTWADKPSGSFIGAALTKGADTMATAIVTVKSSDFIVSYE